MMLMLCRMTAIFLPLQNPSMLYTYPISVVTLDVFQTDDTSIRWQKWFMETSQIITVTGQIYVCLLGESGRVVNSLDFCPASLKSLGCFYFWCVLSSVNLGILHCQLERHFWSSVVIMCLAISNNWLLVLLGDSGRVVNSLDFCLASLKSLGCFYFRCVLSSQWKAVTVHLRILHCQQGIFGGP